MVSVLAAISCLENTQITKEALEVCIKFNVSPCPAKPETPHLAEQK